MSQAAPMNHVPIILLQGFRFRGDKIFNIRISPISQNSYYLRLEKLILPLDICRHLNAISKQNQCIQQTICEQHNIVQTEERKNPSPTLRKIFKFCFQDCSLRANIRRIIQFKLLPLLSLPQHSKSKVFHKRAKS